MGVLDNIKNIFTNDNHERNEQWIEKANKYSVPEYNENNINVDIIDISPNLYLAHRAGRICVGKKPINGTMNDRMVHVENMLNRHHESVTEHTNVIAVLSIPSVIIKSRAASFGQFMALARYCHVVVKEKDDKVNVLIGGSARAFYYLVRETSSNFFVKLVIDKILTKSFEKCLLVPLIELKWIKPEDCTYIPNAKVKEVPSTVTQVKNKYEKTDTENYDADSKDNSADPKEAEYPHVTLIQQTPLYEIVRKVQPYGFSFKDACRVATVSFIFHHISRSCSHQLVRHRNGISQESQRYTAHEYSMENKDEFFHNPITNNEHYESPEFDKVKAAINEIDLFKPYNYLISNKILKEDARAFLPTNVMTQLMMTFTYENYAYFLQLRLDKAAQKEIRELAEESYLTIFNADKINYFIKKLTSHESFSEPKDPLMYLFPDAKSIDEEEPSKLQIETTDDAQKMFEAEAKLKEDEV